MSLLLYILSISFVGILAIFIFNNYLVKKVFYVPHVKNNKNPSDFNLSHNEYFLKTESNKRIQLWDLNPDSDGALILAIHGWRRSADSLLPLTREMTKDSRVFLLNTRNHGESDSEALLSIRKYKKDIAVALAFIRDKIKNNKKIILMGHSFGAAAALEYACESNDIRGLILISVFCDGEKLIRKQFKNNKMPNQIIDSLIHYIEFRNGEKLSKVAPERIIGSISIPTLVLHGQCDGAISNGDFQNLKEKLNKKTEAVAIEDAGHVSILNNKNTINASKNFVKKMNEHNLHKSKYLYKKAE